MGKDIKQARTERGIGEIELARDLGISLDRLRCIEEGRGERPDLSILLMIALKLDLDPKQLYGHILEDPGATQATDPAESRKNLQDLVKNMKNRP